MLPNALIRRSRRATGGFSLVEVALALGIAGFVLVGLIGAIPLASNVSQQSVTQGRSSSIASTIFTSLRTQKFGAVSYLDGGAGTALDLNSLTTSSSAVTYFAYFDETMTTAPANDERRLHFVSAAPTGVMAYHVTLRFNNNPPGTLAPTGTTPHAEANAVELSIYSLAQPKDIYRFSSVVANRAE